jgi:hypothetical protein
MKKEDLSKLVNKLNSSMPAGVECPMCHGRDFEVVDGVFTNSIQQSLNNFQIGGPSVPCVAFVCTHCGFLSQHAIGILSPDLLHIKKGKANNE